MKKIVGIMLAAFICGVAALLSYTVSVEETEEASEVRIIAV